MQWSVETVQQNIQFTECCDHLWLFPLSLSWNDFCFIAFKLAGIIFTLVNKNNHSPLPPNQINSVLCWHCSFHLFGLETLLLATLKFFSSLKCPWGSVQKFTLMLKAFFGLDFCLTESGLTCKILWYFYARAALQNSVPVISRGNLPIRPSVCSGLTFPLCFLSANHNTIMPHYDNHCQIMFCFSLAPLWGSEFQFSNFLYMLLSTRRKKKPFVLHNNAFFVKH